MNLRNTIDSKKKPHQNRSSTTSGIAGEKELLEKHPDWVSRPTGQGMKNLLCALSEELNINIKGTSFDFLSREKLDKNTKLNFKSIEDLKEIVRLLVFVEVKTTKRDNIKSPDFKGYFFGITENEISAANQLGDSYVFYLYHRKKHWLLKTSLQEILNRATSLNRTISVNLGSKESNSLTPSDMLKCSCGRK